MPQDQRLPWVGVQAGPVTPVTPARLSRSVSLVSFCSYVLSRFRRSRVYPPPPSSCPPPPPLFPLSPPQLVFDLECLTAAPLLHPPSPAASKPIGGFIEWPWSCFSWWLCRVWAGMASHVYLSSCLWSHFYLLKQGVQLLSCGFVSEQGARCRVPRKTGMGCGAELDRQLMGLALRPALPEAWERCLGKCPSPRGLAGN